MTPALRLAVLAGTLAAPLAGRAQLPATYAEGRDSLWQRATRVRRYTAARTRLVRTGFVGLGGTRRVVKCYSLPKPDQPFGSANRYQLSKIEIAKHKTHGAQVRKVFYYGPGGRIRLYEYYEDGQLVQLELPGYSAANGPTVPKAGYSMRWVRGDYLTVEVKSPGQPTERRAYASAAPLPQ